MAYNASAHNTKDSIKGKPISSYIRGSNNRITWDVADRRTMMQFLVRNRLGPVEVKEMEPPKTPKGKLGWPHCEGYRRLEKIARELNCVFDERFNDVVHPKIANALRAKLDEWARGEVPVFRVLSDEEATRAGSHVEYAEFTKMWLRPDWNGSTQPPREAVQAGRFGQQQLPGNDSPVRNDSASSNSVRPPNPRRWGWIASRFPPDDESQGEQFSGRRPEQSRPGSQDTYGELSNSRHAPRATHRRRVSEVEPPLRTPLSTHGPACTPAPYVQQSAFSPGTSRPSVSDGTFQPQGEMPVIAHTRKANLDVSKPTTPTLWPQHGGLYTPRRHQSSTRPGPALQSPPADSTLERGRPVEPTAPHPTEIYRVIDSLTASSQDLARLSHAFSILDAEMPRSLSALVAASGQERREAAAKDIARAQCQTAEVQRRSDIALRRREESRRRLGEVWDPLLGAILAGNMASTYHDVVDSALAVGYGLGKTDLLGLLLRGGMGMSGLNGR